MAAALRFYALLGVKAGGEGDHREARLPNGLRLMWDTVELVRSFDPDWVQPVGHGIALAFECQSPGEVDSLFREVVDAGFAAKKEPWDAFWGQRYAQVYDPDENVVDLFASLS